MKTVYRLCYSYLGNAADAEDATQSVFIKLVDTPREFEDAEHEKAWLLVCAANLCKDILKSAQRSRTTSLPETAPETMPDHEPVPGSDDALASDATLQAVLALPAIYKDVVYLHYYEGYKTDEIAEICGSPPSTVRNRLSEARKLLRKTLGGEDDDGT